MPSPLPSTLASPAVAPASLVAPVRSAQPDAAASGEGFSQALEQAQAPKEQALDEADAESTLPLPEPDQVDGEALATDPAGITALLAQWRSAPTSAAAAESRTLPADADGTGPDTDTNADPTVLGTAAWSALAASKAATKAQAGSRTFEGATTALQGAASNTALINDKAFALASLVAAGTSPSQGQSTNAEALALTAAMPLPASAVGAATAPAAAPATSQAHLPASPGSAQFASQLGAQITTFVRDGIQNARLNLNPADMGPVSVRIQIDGTQAQIHLGADQSATRQALEQAMPLLASSLREAGLTLAGGGVFEQARQGQNPDAQPARDGQAVGRSRSDPDQAGSDSDPLAATLSGRRRGVVDLVA